MPCGETPVEQFYLLIYLLAKEESRPVRTKVDNCSFKIVLIVKVSMAQSNSIIRNHFHFLCF